MKPLLLHPTTSQAIDSFVGKPSHGLLVIAPKGSGKGALARQVSARLLGTTTVKLLTHPYFMLVSAHNGKIIAVDDIRAVIHFTLLKTTGKSGSNRVVVIEDSHLLTVKAQNALLKTIEEPPAGTVIILTAISEASLLPTICSRLQHINIHLLDSQTIKSYFESHGYPSAAVDKSILISGGLLGMVKALLDESSEQPLIKATNIAHTILQQLAFERIAMIDDLAKDRQLCFDVLFTLGQMASISLKQGGKSSSVVHKWQRVLSASHVATQQLLTSAQPKLVLLNFMLSL
ncbi:MAG: hypothetical protein ACREF5_03100 [Candidatus Saccharimonadales bacterium]